MKILSLQSVLFMTFLWKHNSKEFIKNWFSIDKENQFFYNWLLGQGPVSIVEFFADPKNGTLGTNKPPAMQVSQEYFSLQ